jgi:putative FmdB family regulatory protein
MPTYEYKCPSCNKVESHFHKISDQIKVMCIECFNANKPYDMIKGPGGGSAIHFKGSGFYETDYKGR